ncbi:MAG: hypothetical protein Q7T56_04245 [Nocardioidaceae bacterium]|nr:hypothetical protein [Nocardioidaceae bacterium]
MSDPLLLPPGTRLVHVGPHKTGTTAIQSALFHHRELLAEHGVLYAGDRQHSSVAVKSLTGQAPSHRRADPEGRRWRALARQVRRAGEQRVVLSSEVLSDLDDAAAERMLDDVERHRVHVVVTVRPLASILPSQWQQRVQLGERLTYEDWLRSLLDDPDGSLGRAMWRRHRHDDVVRRWASRVGTENVTVVVVDAADRTALTRAFEQMLGLPQDSLVPPPDETNANRSLTLGEAEVVRQVNLLADGAGVDRRTYSGLMRYGAITYLKGRPPAADEPAVSTPAWALPRVGGIGRASADGIEASGVRVVGDLDVLRAEPLLRGDPSAAPVVTPEIAARAFVAAVVGTRRHVRHEARSEARTPVAEPTTAELVQLLRDRARARLTRRRQPPA